MKKRIVLVGIIVICICLVGGYLLIESNNRKSDDEFLDSILSEPKALEANMIFTNKFFGAQVIAPKGWYVINLNQRNLNEGGVDTEEESNLNSYYNSDQDCSFVEMATFFNMKDQADSYHIEVNVFAEKFNLTFDEYLQSVVNYAESEQGGYPDEFLKENLAVINEVSYRTLHLQSVREEDRYLTDYYICERQGYYFCMRFVYWVENTEAENEITKYISENITWY